MKAAVVTGPGATPALLDAAEPTGEGELISVTAAALSQLARGRASGGHYSAGGAFPFVAGVDGVGPTEAGDRVYFILPDPPQGAMAERVIVPAARVLPLPDGLDDVTAAAIANPGMSSMVALTQRALLKPGETVLVHGATGASGRLAVRIARHLGAARIVATGRNRAELDAVLDYLWRQATEPLIEAAARAQPAGRPVRWVQLGSAAGGSLSLTAAALRASGLVLMGSGLGSVSLAGLIEGIAAVFAAAGPAGLSLPIRLMPLADVAAAWTAPGDGRRIVLLPGG